MYRPSSLCAITFLALIQAASNLPSAGQQTAAQNPAKPIEHVLGTVTAVDASAHTITVREDGSGTTRKIQVGETRTLLKVAPGAKDIKNATRITADDLAAGDRVDVRGYKAESDPDAINARSVILMSATDVQKAHQTESAAWQHASTGIVTTVDTAGQKIGVNLRTSEGVKPITVDTEGAQFTRYSPEHPQTPTASQIAEIQIGDQVRFLPPAGPDSTTQPAHAQKLYSGTFKTAVGTVVSIAPDGKSLVMKDLQTKKPVNVSLAEDSTTRKLPPMMAYMLARRLNPDFKGTGPAQSGDAGGHAPNGPGSERPSGGPPAPTSPEGPPAGQGPSGPGGTGMARTRSGNGDLSQMIERLPRISATDLKPGDAVVVSGSPAKTSGDTLLARTVIAGVEPIFQSASPKQAQSLGDWNSALGGNIAGADGSGGPQ